MEFAFKSFAAVPLSFDGCRPSVSKDEVGRCTSMRFLAVRVWVCAALFVFEDKRRKGMHRWKKSESKRYRRKRVAAAKEEEKRKKQENAETFGRGEGGWGEENPRDVRGTKVGAGSLMEKGSWIVRDAKSRGIGLKLNRRQWPSLVSVRDVRSGL